MLKLIILAPRSGRSSERKRSPPSYLQLTSSEAEAPADLGCFATASASQRKRRQGQQGRQGRQAWAGAANLLQETHQGRVRSMQKHVMAHSSRELRRMLGPIIRQIGLESFQKRGPRAATDLNPSKAASGTPGAAFRQGHQEEEPVPKHRPQADLSFERKAPERAI